MMWSVIRSFFWPILISFVFSYVFYVLRDEAEKPPWLVPSGRHFRIRQNQPEHAPGWFGSNWHWLLIIPMFLVILNFLRCDDNDCTPPGHQDCSSGPPNIEVPADAQNNITIHEVRDTGDPDGVGFRIKEEVVDELYPN